MIKISGNEFDYAGRSVQEVITELGYDDASRLESMSLLY